MSTTRVRIDPDNPATLPQGRFDAEVVDGTTEAEIAKQQREDDAEARQDMARYARRVRRRLGLSQVELARRIDVPHETIRNWGQGKRCPTGAARALVRVLDKAPEAALRGLTLVSYGQSGKGHGVKLYKVPEIMEGHYSPGYGATRIPTLRATKTSTSSAW